MGEGYRAAYARWESDPDGFWLAEAEGVAWHRKPSVAFDPSAGVYGRWFPDGECNICHNALDRHVEAGNGDRAALIYDSPVTGSVTRFTYRELLAEVEACAAFLQDLGTERGDRVVIYMPMVPEAMIGMLACARLGAIHSVVFGGFAARELASRIDDCRPKIVLSASCGIEPTRVVSYKPLLDEAIALAVHKPQACVILQRERQPATIVAGRDHDWARLRADALGRDVPCVPVRATDPLYIIYTSGTTGRPKGVVRDTGGYLLALNWSMGAIFDIRAGEVMFTASDVGWVVGHSYIVYGPLIAGATTVLYEGKPVGTPDAGAYWRVCADHGVKVLFTAPTAIRAVRREDPDGTHYKARTLPGLAALFLAGERADPATVAWAEETLGRPVVDHWWQTESGWPIVANPLGLGALPVKRGSPTVPMPGFRVEALDDEGRVLPRGTLGNIAIALPLPPGALPTLWQADERFREAYLDAYPGWYATSDAGSVDEDGYVWVMGRTDDVINVAGHRLSTGAMEEAVASHPAVAECAVIAVADPIKGECPCAFVVMKAGAGGMPEEVATQTKALVRERIGAVAGLSRVVVVDRLPKTRSGKILRRTMRQIAEGQDHAPPATIEDPAVLGEIARAWAAP